MRKKVLSLIMGHNYLCGKIFHTKICAEKFIFDLHGVKQEHFGQMLTYTIGYRDLPHCSLLQWLIKGAACQEVLLSRGEIC